MRALLQRVTSAQVAVEGAIVGKIGPGWLVLLGVGRGDTPEIANWLAKKCVGLRGFNDDQGKMNRSVTDVAGAMLVVSQFTLYGNCQHGRRPGFDAAAPPAVARALFERFCDEVRELGVPVEQGIFQADMQVTLVNDGPVTLWVEKEGHADKSPENTSPTPAGEDSGR
jgi:D-tyrosyl-tRNA(Tyr) deacylase